MSFGIDPIPPPGPVTIGPSVSARLATWRALLAMGQQAQGEGKAILTRLRAFDQLGPAPPSSFLPAPQNLAARGQAEAGFERASAELQKHLDASSAIAAGRASATPSALYDLDVLSAVSPGLSDLGVVVVLVAIVAGATVAVAGIWAYVSTLREHQHQRMAALIERGKDVSPLLQVTNPPPTTTKGIASITTPIAVAASVYGLAMLAKNWKRT